MALTDNLVAYYKLDGNSNDSVGSNNGTDSNITYGSSYGKINQGALFNGSSSKIDLSNNLNSVTYNSSYSFQFWFNISSFPTGSTFYKVFGNDNSSASNGVFIDFYGGNLRIGNNGGANISYPFSNFSTNTWYHIVVTYTYNSNMLLYVNGNLVLTSSGTGAALSTSDGAAFGYYRSLPGRYFNGDLDELGVWSRALSDTEITTLYNGGAGLTYPFTAANNSNFFNFF